MCWAGRGMLPTERVCGGPYAINKMTLYRQNSFRSQHVEPRHPRSDRCTFRSYSGSITNQPSLGPFSPFFHYSLSSIISRLPPFSPVGFLVRKNGHRGPPLPYSMCYPGCSLCHVGSGHPPVIHTLTLMTSCQKSTSRSASSNRLAFSFWIKISPVEECVYEEHVHHRHVY